MSQIVASIHKIERLPSSVNGNARFELTLDYAGKLTRLTTKSDASVNYDIENLYNTRRDDTEYRFGLTRNDRIEMIFRLDGSLL